MSFARVTVVSKQNLVSIGPGMHELCWWMSLVAPLLSATSATLLLIPCPSRSDAAVVILRREDC